MTKKCRVWSAERGMGARDLAVGHQAQGCGPHGPSVAWRVKGANVRPPAAKGHGPLDRINRRDRIIRGRHGEGLNLLKSTQTYLILPKMKQSEAI